MYHVNGYSGKLRPKNYKGVEFNEDESLSMGKYPTFSWSSDSFTNWLTQNAVNIGVSSLTTALTAASLGATGNIAGAIGSVVGTIGNTIGSGINALTAGNKAEGNANSGDVSFIQDLIRFKVMHMRAKREYLEVIDNYFSCFGYKVNATKLPNITGRTNWNYVKTINANIEGDIPQEDLQKIKDILNNGVTFWHNPLTFLDYSQTNTII